MKRIIVTAVFGLFATSALAIENGDPFSTGDSNGPHQPSGVAAYGYSPDTYYAPNQYGGTADFVPFGDTAPFPTGISGAQSPQRDSDEISHQNAANKAWRAEAHRRAQEGWRDGNLSVYFAAQDWNGAIGGGKSPDPYGGPVGASIGGSD